jgi:hypothetical protein
VSEEGNMPEQGAVEAALAGTRAGIDSEKEVAKASAGLAAAGEKLAEELAGAAPAGPGGPALVIEGQLMHAEEMPALATQVVAEEVQPILDHANALVVNDEASYKLAMEGVVRCKQGIARVEKRFGESRELAHKLWKSITTAIGSITNPLQQAAGLYGTKAYTFEQAENKRRQEEAEAKEREEAKRREAEKTKVANFLDAAGETEEAIKVLEKPVEPVAPVKPQALAKPKGTSSRENWQWACEDLAALVKAAAAGQVPLAVVAVNEVTVTRMVKALKSETRLPGIRTWDAGTVAARVK